MLKLVRSEISYIKWPLMICGIFTLIEGFHRPDYIYYMNQPIVTLYCPWKTFYTMLTFVLPMVVGLSMVLLYLYMMERRTRQAVAVPISLVQTGIARLVTPFLITAYFVIIILIPIAFHSVVRFQDIITTWNLWTDPSQPWIQVGSKSYPPIIMLHWINLGSWAVVSRILFIIYAMWLISEKIGRWLIGAYLAFSFLFDGAVLLINSWNPWQILNSYVEIFKGDILHPSLFYLAAGFIIITFVSFMKRGSYLW
jgi:hypothetical protein